MKQFFDYLNEQAAKAFEQAGYDPALGKVTLSNRPDLCEFQCNGAMAGAKQYHKAPLQIAQEAAAVLEQAGIFESVEVVRPGFINLKADRAFLSRFLTEMSEDHLNRLRGAMREAGLAV